MGTAAQTPQDTIRYILAPPGKDCGWQRLWSAGTKVNSVRGWEGLRLAGTPRLSGALAPSRPTEPGESSTGLVLGADSRSPTIFSHSGSMGCRLAA